MGARLHFVVIKDEAEKREKYKYILRLKKTLKNWSTGRREKLKTIFL